MWDVRSNLSFQTKKEPGKLLPSSIWDLIDRCASQRFVGVAAWPGLACFRSSGSKQKNCNSPGLKTWKFLMTGVQHPGRVWRLQRAAAPLREMSQCKHQDSQEETAPTSTVNWTVFYWLNWRLMALKNLLMLFINWTRKNTILWSGCHVMFLFYWIFSLLGF